MAKVIESDKGFKLISCNSISAIQVFGGGGICDKCNETPDKGVYIAVLNSWYCNDCFNGWHKKAISYPQDKEIELKNFNRYKPLFEQNDKSNEVLIEKIKQDRDFVSKAKEKLYGNEFVIVNEPEILCVIVEEGTGVNGTSADVCFGKAKLFDSVEIATEAMEKAIIFSPTGKIEFSVISAYDYFDRLEIRVNEILENLTN